MPKDSVGLEDMLIVNTLARIDGKLDKLDDRMDGMQATLAVQQQILDEHVRRTGLLEEKIEADTSNIRSEFKEGLKEGLAREAAEAVRAERNKLLVLGLKIGGVVAGLGGGGLGLKTLLPALAKLFGGDH